MWLEVFLFFVVVLVLRYYLTRPKGLPPGPFLFPFVGNKPVFAVDDAKNYRKKYGDIFMTEFCGMRTLFLCKYNNIKEAFSRLDMADRPDWESVHFLSEGVPAGVIMTNGKHWLNARRFLLRNLRDLGMGKTYLEEAIQTEAAGLVKDFETHSGGPTGFPRSINVAVLNVVWQMVASKRFDLDDDGVLDIVQLFREADLGPRAMLAIFFPRATKMMPRFIRRKWLLEEFFEEVTKKSRKICKDMTDSHRATLDPDNPRDVVDEYLIAMDAKSDIAEYFSELDLLKIVFDLFSAGFDTVSNTLRWFILYMAKYPEVQQRVQQQIDEVVPQNTLPSYEHKPKLPLVEALVHEVLRMSSLIALGVAHRTSADLNFAGYFIPKDTLVMAAAVCCHEDPQYWERPEEFRLEHFLDENGNFVSQKEGFLPFSTGRRSCLGEALARMELYIFTSALLQNFTFSAPEGREVDLTPSPKQPQGRQVQEQDIVIKIRNTN